MELKAKSSDIDESSDDEDFKMKSYITRQFEKFMKNVNAKGFDKDRKQSSLSQFKNQGFGHMKQECPTYLKTIGKSKALTATLSDTEPEDDSDNENDGILNAFTAIVDSTNGSLETIDDEKDLVDSKFEKMDDQDDIHAF